MSGDPASALGHAGGLALGVTVSAPEGSRRQLQGRALVMLPRVMLLAQPGALLQSSPSWDSLHQLLGPCSVLSSSHLHCLTPPPL